MNASDFARQQLRNMLIQRAGLQQNYQGPMMDVYRRRLQARFQEPQPTERGSDQRREDLLASGRVGGGNWRSGPRGLFGIRSLMQRY